MSDAERDAACCVGKHRFDSLAHAAVAVRRQNKRGEGRVAPYRCDRCRGFHVGQQNGPTLRRSERRARPERPQDFRPDNEYDRRRR